MSGWVTESERSPAVAAAVAFHAGVIALGGVVLEPAWLGNKVRHRVRCAAGHETTARPNNVLSGLGHLPGLPIGVAPRIEQDVLAALRLAGEAPVRGREYYTARVTALILDVVDN